MHRLCRPASGEAAEVGTSSHTRTRLLALCGAPSLRSNFNEACRLAQSSWAPVRETDSLIAIAQRAGHRRPRRAAPAGARRTCACLRSRQPFFVFVTLPKRKKCFLAFKRPRRARQSKAHTFARLLWLRCSLLRLVMRLVIRGLPRRLERPATTKGALSAEGASLVAAAAAEHGGHLLRFWMLKQTTAPWHVQSRPCSRATAAPQLKRRLRFAPEHCREREALSFRPR